MQINLSYQPASGTQIPINSPRRPKWPRPPQRRPTKASAIHEAASACLRPRVWLPSTNRGLTSASVWAMPIPCPWFYCSGFLDLSPAAAAGNIVKRFRKTAPMLPSANLRDPRELFELPSSRCWPTKPSTPALRKRKTPLTWCWRKKMKSCCTPWSGRTLKPAATGLRRQKNRSRNDRKRRKPPALQHMSKMCPATGQTVGLLLYTVF